MYIYKSFLLLAALLCFNGAVAYDKSLITPVEPPYVCDFSEQGESAFEENWRVIDANSDGMKWVYSPWTEGIDGEMGVAVCYGSYEGDLTNDDYLVSMPINLNAGYNYLSFFARGGYSDAIELLELFYAPAESIDDMSLISSFSLSGPEWQQRLFNFNIAESGTYCIAFHYCSTDGAMLALDNVAIGMGYMQPSPTLSILKLILPVSNCDLSEESPIGVVLKNTGTAPCENFDLKCKISSTYGQTQEMEEHFELTIAPNETATVFFEHKADLSDIDNYECVVQGICNEQEISSETGIVSAMTPLSLPLSTDFSDGTLGQWVELNPGSWTFDSFSKCIQGASGGEGNGLLSRCFEASGRLRMKICYGASAWTSGKMHVAIGKAGSDIAFYRTIYDDSDYLDTKVAEFEFDFTDLDHYCILIVNDDLDEWGQDLMLKSIEISHVRDYDLAISQVTAALSPYTPIEHLSKSTPITVEVTNRGLKDCEGVEIKALSNNEIIGSAVLDSVLTAGDTALAVVYADLSAFSVGDRLDIKIIVDSEITDGYWDDNMACLPTVLVTENLRANENISDFSLGVGKWGEPIAIGNLYALACDDVLTAIEIGLSDCDEIIVQEKEICVSFYELGNDFHSLGRCMYSQSLRRGEGGLMRISLDPMLLHAGNYYFEVCQLTNVNMGLAYDYAEGNFCYQREDHCMERIDNGLALVIRAIFEEANAPKHDVAPISILNPSKPMGLYSAQQDFSVAIKNLGSENALSKISCYVNGFLLGERNISLQPYEILACDFGPFDMSLQGEYLLEAITYSDFDENSINDTISSLFVAQEEASPYTLDFEYCSDFDSGNEIFNPRWRTIDRNSCETDGFWQYSYPYHSMPVGFIAFNPQMTVPSMMDNSLPGFYPHEGARFGAAFTVAPPFDSTIEHSDIWLLSPKLKLGNCSALEMYVKTRDLEWEGQPLERYQILISDTDDEFDSFKVIGAEIREASSVEWEKIYEDLSVYDNREIYVAIRYIGIPGENVVLMVDDIKVITEIESNADCISSTMDFRYDNGVVSVSNATPIERISVHNAYGNEILSVYPNQESFKIDLSRYAHGLYLITATTCSTQSSFKILK